MLNQPTTQPTANKETKAMINFNETTIATYVNAPNAFVIELTEELWSELGWTQKSDCIRDLKKELIEGVDFKADLLKTPEGGRPSVSYTLSYNGLKLLAVSAPGKNSRRYRRHLVEVENHYYELLKQQQQNVRKALPPMWLETRFALKDVEAAYQSWCIKNGFSASRFTNLIYKEVCDGDDAAALRLKALVDGEAKVAANHIEDSERLQRVADIKLRLTRYTRYFATMNDALAQALKDLG
jgi:hypothetical protein